MLAQFGWTKIYDQQFYKIGRAQIFYNQSLTGANLFILLGTDNAAQNNDAGRVYRMNRNTLQFYSPFQNGFDRIWYFSGFPTPTYHISVQNTFNISMLDTGFGIRNFVSGCGLDCGDMTYYTTNYGTNWISVTALSNGFLGSQSRGYDIDPKNAQIAYSIYPRLGSGRDLIYKTTDKGLNWNIIDSLQSNSYQIPQGYTKINPFRSNYIYYRGNSNLMISTNSGTGFAPAQNSVSFEQVRFSRFDSAVVAYNSTSLYKSTNHGLSWSVLGSLPENIRSLEISAYNTNIYFAGTDFGLYRSTNKGANWQKFNDSFNPSKKVIGISSDLAGGDTIFVVTSDAVYKVWGSYVGIQQISTEIPQSFSLSQNYPNPFNPTTNFEFRIADFGLVRLTVFDAIGREIEVLVNQQMHPGTYEVSWDASTYPSGVYYYRLEAGSFAKTKKMVLIR
ncbi:MAG: T9SS type A sorting domain-containing protein [Ignavibacteria bacterium]|nr:T9SS type A sorting domain-containing protein [Ignavibacteria bacterium]